MSGIMEQQSAAGLHKNLLAGAALPERVEMEGNDWPDTPGWDLPPAPGSAWNPGTSAG